MKWVKSINGEMSHIWIVMKRQTQLVFVLVSMFSTITDSVWLVEQKDFFR